MFNSMAATSGKRFGTSPIGKKRQNISARGDILTRRKCKQVVVRGIADERFQQSAGQERNQRWVVGLNLQALSVSDLLCRNKPNPTNTK